MANPRANALLGYPPDARLLILNADDLGMYTAINAAILSAFQEGAVSSTTLMVPCPAARAGMQLLQEHPEMPFGVHLTVIRDMEHYPYGPLTPAEKVSSLVDGAGNFYSTDDFAGFLARAALPELEVEFRAQIETALSTGLKPTHLDWHCLHNGGRADIFDLTMRLASDYGLAVRVADRLLSQQLQARGLPTVNYDLLDSFSIPTADKPACYLQMLRDLQVGLSEWAVHPGLGDAAARVVDPDGWPVRRADYDFLISPEARETIREEGIVVLSYKPLQSVWRARARPSL